MRQLIPRVLWRIGWTLTLLPLAAPAAADWLVTRAGSRVETSGPWETKGKVVVFTQLDGSLASLRLAEVDLQASGQATAEAKAETKSPAVVPSAAKKRLAVLTDETLVRARKEPAGKPARKPAGPAAEESSAGAKPQATVTVINWRRLESADGAGLEIHGTLQNNTDKIAANVSVEVQLYNEAGELVATAPGMAGATSIHPNGFPTEFRAAFPGVFTFAEVKFETKGWPLEISPAPSAEPPQGSSPP